ncbi:hepatoma-derived growth factor-related protein 3 isoform X1 [Erinaceus europaeus]|uniref:Hepatoma-derived growth factor-related protein 3 isoform X1 n=1 Tax=Erinaceus europaeus TaxID=9365 RepID=A0ABM3WG31_ERIEU|nr:hepatoma-derived growth factor-related protein 3 isoform X1 [Erinaceus europaeus]
MTGVRDQVPTAGGGAPGGGPRAGARPGPRAGVPETPTSVASCPAPSPGRPCCWNRGARRAGGARGARANNTAAGAGLGPGRRHAARVAAAPPGGGERPSPRSALPRGHRSAGGGPGGAASAAARRQGQRRRDGAPAAPRVQGGRPGLRQDEGLPALAGPDTRSPKEVTSQVTRLKWSEVEARGRRTVLFSACLSVCLSGCVMEWTVGQLGEPGVCPGLCRGLVTAEDCFSSAQVTVSSMLTPPAWEPWQERGWLGPMAVSKTLHI